MLQHTSKHIGRETERYKERDTEAHMHPFIHRWGRYTRTYDTTHTYTFTHTFTTHAHTHIRNTHEHNIHTYTYTHAYIL